MSGEDVQTPDEIRSRIDTITAILGDGDAGRFYSHKQLKELAKERRELEAQLKKVSG